MLPTTLRLPFRHLTMLVELIQTGLPTLPGRTFYVINRQPTGPFVRLASSNGCYRPSAKSGNR